MKELAFRERVFSAVRRIPKGRVATYGAVAKVVGCGSAQAVGQALKGNRDSAQTPCHRVVRRDGFLGGYFGSLDGAVVARKRQLLENEGVHFLSDGRVDLAQSGYTFDGDARATI